MNAGPLLRVGIIGYGVMGKAHSYGYRVAPMLRPLQVTPVVTLMSGRDAGAVRAAAAAYRVPATVADWRELIVRDDVDMVDICSRRARMRRWRSRPPRRARRCCARSRWP